MWQGKKCAVVLTYDDAIPQQLDNALPVLDSLGLKATFYLTAYFAKDRLNDWKAVAAKGHELGNHTLFHPCNGGTGREWVQADYDLRNYSVRRMIDEVRMTNVFLQALDGKTRRTFAYTCGDQKVQDSAFINALKKDFTAARSVRSQLHTAGQVNLYDVDCYSVHGHTAAQMIAWVQQAAASRSLLVILFHGVGGGNPLNVSVEAHRAFLQYLKQQEQDLWIPTMLQAAEHIQAIQSASSTQTGRP